MWGELSILDELSTVLGAVAFVFRAPHCRTLDPKLTALICIVRTQEPESLGYTSRGQSRMHDSDREMKQRLQLVFDQHLMLWKSDYSALATI